MNFRPAASCGIIRLPTDFGGKSRPNMIGVVGPYISPSNNPTLAPAAPSDAAMFTAIVDLPTPPFPLPTATMLRTPFNADLSSCGVCRTSLVILISTF